jgi:hypothetical protein
MFVSGFAVIDGLLFVPDRYQNRFLGFPVASLATDMEATRVLGEPDFSTLGFTYSSADGSAMVNPPSPDAILADLFDDYVWLSDGGNRVVRIRWERFPAYLYPR